MARARASLAISEPEFDEAWPVEMAVPARSVRRLAAAPALDGSDFDSAYLDPADFGSADLGADAIDDRPRPGFETAIEPRAGSATLPRGTAVPGRRTVTIRGQVAARPAPRRPRRDPYDRVGSRPDRIAMWAVVLCVLLILVAATSSHAAVLHLALHARP
jgi:hypothetical protein